jgi:Methyltransferase domain
MRGYFFKEYLKFFWLRPENALLLALRADALQKTFKYFDQNKKSVDISCGDGVFSFIAMGGMLSESVDMFRSVNLSRTFRQGNYDAFDFFNEDYFINVNKTPSKNYYYGTDWKENLLKKAEKLGFYNELIQHDNNYKLPFNDQEMQFVYSNSAYWVDKFEAHLKDMVRITEPNGLIVLEMKHKEIINYTSSNYIPFMGNKFHKIINAGRLHTWKGLRTKEEILNILKSIDEIEIELVEPIYGDILARIWDIGLRPLFNPLVKMANNLTEEQRIDIKLEWCNIIYELFIEFLEDYTPEEHSAIEHLIVLRKK